MKRNRYKMAGKRIALAGIIAATAISTTVKAEVDISELEYDLPQQKVPVSNTPPEKAATGLGVGALIGAAVGGPVGAFLGGVGGIALVESDEQHQRYIAANEQLQQITTDLKLAKFELEDAKMLLKQQEERDAIKLASLQNDLMHKQELESEHNQAMRAVSDGFTMAVQFRSGSSEIEQHYVTLLQKLAGSLAVLSDFEIELSGYTDPRGEEIPNLELSSKRVDKVKQILVDAGVAKERISASSLGEGELMCKLGDTKGYQFERRVEINFRFISEDQGGRLAQN